MKKRIVVVTSDVPFVEGGHLTIARSTVRALRDSGHEADLILTPQNRFGRQFRAYLANRFTDIEEDGLGRKIDQVISFRYPSYAVKHRFHVCWLNHRLREYYDLWEAFSSRMTLKGRLKENLRRVLIRTLDNYFLKHNVTKLFAQSKTIQARLMKWGKIKSEVLYPPPPQRNYRTDDYQNFIFSPSRLQKLKRLDLLVEAFRHVKNPEMKAMIAGEGPEENALRQLIEKYGLINRVHLFGPADEQTLLSHYARCLAVFFCPVREDYGFVTGEAFASRKAVLTAVDSGGPPELVKDGVTGYVLDPQPEIIARKIDELAENKDLAIEMGTKASAFIATFTWEQTINKLLIC